jgi:glycosyltransferase involved in cell wall biosynthesis
MTAGLGVRDSVTFTGRVSDEELGRIYCESAVYAMPSEGEGFGLVFAEAMSYALPCIASRFDAGSEVVVHGETGLHVDPNDDASLLEALLRLLDDESLRRELGVAGRRRAQEHFGLEAFGRNLLAALSGDATPRVEGT